MNTLQPSFRQRLVAEALRLEEDRLGRLVDDPGADRLAQAVVGTFEQRVIARALATEWGREAMTVVSTLDGGSRAVLVAVPALGLIAGVLATLAVFGTDPTVNIGVALSTLLGLQLLLLVFWGLLIVTPLGVKSQRGGWFGHMALFLTQRLLSWWNRGPVTATVVAAGAALMRRDGLGIWLGSLLSHLLWFAFSLGALVAAVMVLSFRQYDFVWGTTLLNEHSFIAVAAVLGAPAQGLGWAVPDAELVRASRIGMAAEQGRELWSNLLLSALLFFGLLPRLALAALSAVQVKIRILRLRLDTGLPGYARLSERLGVAARRAGVIDPAPPDEVAGVLPAQRGRPARVTGSALVIGLELEREGVHWPPRPAGIHWVVLGRADDRSQRRDVLAALQAFGAQPGVVIVLCSLARTPDRGSERFIAQIKAASVAPLWVVLDEANRLADRGGQREQRIEQWRECAERAGADFVLAAELDHANDPGTRNLRTLLGS